MKISRSLRTRAAFTLIELLVVISIIAVLAGMGFSGMKGAMESAKKVQAKNDMTQIANAVQFYYTEYGRYPVPTADQGDDSRCVYGTNATKGNEKIINVLRYPSSTSGSTWTDAESLNPRQIKFLEVTNAKDQANPKSGIRTGSASNGAWYDPWGSQYIIFIDGDYAGDIDPSPAYGSGVLTTGATKVQIGVGAATVGFYNNKKNTTALLPRAFDRSYDLISWQ